MTRRAAKHETKIGVVLSDL